MCCKADSGHEDELVLVSLSCALEDRFNGSCHGNSALCNSSLMARP